MAPRVEPLVHEKALVWTTSVAAGVPRFRTVGELAEKLGIDPARLSKVDYVAAEIGQRVREMAGGDCDPAAIAEAALAMARRNRAQDP